ncbi:hypothetical protein BN14_10668 [Rhizoctonia solani AG-1 IB]|uniref:Uncharacterized protein n=1 Tax=Thanatephorus cucumeris (strain AG1-IB / isolate 7/3/14) TaxID=1108050 RepID=M5CBR8_THACB|nr:hypothetical protein BN14_10668 [Rhizoctonia solani AG-1 IB]
MSASQRTAIAGYLDSSEDEKALREIPLGQLGNKKTKVNSTALPRLSGSSHTTLPGFRFPQSGSSARGPVPPTGRLPSQPHGPTSEPGTSSRPVVSTAAKSSMAIPSTLLNQEHSLSSDSEDLDGTQPGKRVDDLTRTQPVQSQIGRLKDTTRARSTVASERQYNELKALVDDARRVGEEQYKDVNHKMDLVLLTLGRLEAMRSSHSDTIPPNPSIQTLSPLDDTQNYSANPLPTDELSRIVARVLNDQKNRVGKKKGGVEENSLKEHTRDSWYGMLEVECSKDITVYFEHKNGEPDTLPLIFVNPQTGYCRPRPHWKKSLLKQLAWIMTFLSDEQIIILLCDGPFKTATTVWRDRKYTDAQIQELQSIERRKHRAVCKATVRRSYTTGIPSLRGQDWEYLTHPGYMSAEESDSEEQITIKRPAYRATWVNNLFEAIGVAELKRGVPITGSTVSIVPLSIPKLERKGGAGHETVRIPLCSLGKAWREENTEEVNASADLINCGITIKPSIDGFLSEHPVDAKRAGSFHSDGDSRMNTNNNNATQEGKDNRDELFGFPIDPELLSDTIHPQTIGTEPADTATSAVSASSTTEEASVFTTSTNHGLHSVHNFQMPPPPPLTEADQNPNISNSVPKKRGRLQRKDAGDTAEVSSRATRSIARLSTQDELESQGLETQDEDIAPLKKRGRPPGSKNKKK